MKSSKNLVILVTGIFLAVCLMGHSAGRNTAARADRVERAENPYQDSTVLIEAFMVEVPLSQLHDLSLPVISEGSKFASAEQILKCLKKPDAAIVTAGAKLAVVHNQMGTTHLKSQQGMYSGPPENRNVNFVEVGTRLRSSVQITPDGKIHAQLEFQHSNLEESDATEDFGPLLTERSWSNSISLKPGKPTLAGATHGEEMAQFLIVTANIQK
ncbi:MAG: hypothetical protein ACYS8Z_13030 [Planctomycetota bacterium]|jgi:hypothetical protein